MIRQIKSGADFHSEWLIEPFPNAKPSGFDFVCDIGIKKSLSDPALASHLQEAGKVITHRNLMNSASSEGEIQSRPFEHEAYSLLHPR